MCGIEVTNCNRHKAQDVKRDKKSKMKIAHCETNKIPLQTEGSYNQIKDHTRLYKGE